MSHGPEVKARSLAIGVLLLAAGCGVASQVKFPAAPPANVMLSGSLVKPDRPGRFPAVILVHGGGGLAYEPHVVSYQAQWRREGFVALVFESWASRGLGPAMLGGVPPDAFAERILDGFGAVQYLRSLPEVDGDRIVVIGFSDGGRVGLHVAAGMDATGEPLPNVPLPRAVVGYYPSCFAGMGRPAAMATLKVPYLAHVAELDDWPGPKVCPEVFERLLRAGAPLEVYRYPGAYHTFDDARLVPPRRGPQGTVGYDGRAAELAWERTLAFVRKHLKLDR